MFTMDDLTKPKRLEKSFERDTLVKRIKKIFPDCYEIPKPVRPSSKGTPDRQFCIDGKFIAIEAKQEKKGRPSSLQLKRIEEIRKSGGIAFIAETWEDVVENLKGVFECLK